MHITIVLEMQIITYLIQKSRKERKMFIPNLRKNICPLTWKMLTDGKTDLLRKELSQQLMFNTIASTERGRNPLGA